MFGRHARVGLVLAAASVAMVVGGCGASSGSTSDTNGLTSVTLPISFQDGPVLYPFAVARKLGYFKAEGLSVKVQPTDGSSFVTQQLLAGNTDWGMANAPAAIIASTKDSDVRVASCFQERLLYEIVAVQGSDVHSVADLKGKTLGTTEVGSGEYPYADAFLRDAGLDPNNDVKLLPIGDGTPATQHAMETGQVDAYISETTVLHTLANKGVKFDDITPPRFTRVPQTCFVTTSSVLKDPGKRKLFVGIVRAFTKGTNFGLANPGAAVNIVCADLPETCQDKDVAEQQLRDTTQLVTPIDKSVPVGGIDLAGWQAAGDVVLDSGQVSKKVDVATIVDSPEVVSARKQILGFDAQAVRDQARNYHN